MEWNGERQQARKIRRTEETDNWNGSSNYEFKAKAWWVRRWKAELKDLSSKMAKLYDLGVIDHEGNLEE